MNGTSLGKRVNEIVSIHMPQRAAFLIFTAPQLFALIHQFMFFFFLRHFKSKFQMLKLISQRAL
jgi:hypothetical protein